LLLNIFTHRDFVAALFDRNELVYEKRPLCIFGPTWGLCTVTAVFILRLTGKRVVDFLLVIIEILSLGVTAEVLRANINWKSPCSKLVGQYGPNFQVEGDAPTNTFFVAK